MIKYSLVLINFIGLYFAGLFSEPVVNVTTTMPTALASGERTLVTVSIDKPGTSGFAKLELNLPFGLVASPSETNGASFTFSGQKAKFIWMALPEEDTFSISYYMEALPDANGQKEVTGVFSYIKENQRVDFNLAPRAVLITPSQSLAENIEKTAEVAAAAADQNLAVPDATATLPMAVALTCSRSIEKLSDTEFNVNLRIENNNIHGFAKILETLPLNCKAEKIIDGGAVVTADEQTIKFVWFDVPQNASIDVSYRMSCVLPVNGAPEINGKLSFIENNAPAEIAVVDKGMTSGVVAQQQPENPVENPAKEIENPVTPKEVQTEIAQNPAKETEVPPTKTVTPPVKTVVPEKESVAVTSVPDPETGITYKVQILAAHKVVGKTYFSSVHSYSEKFDIENHDGWVKYTTGKFADYKQARDTRERLKSSYQSLPGPFVTAYNDGQRITVQEALLISKQQWYQ
ncbi:MAG: hypothetical protein JNM00_09625 [Flavobacteriales bacterium]|nr:hypothetical protein [Flavobacteriales bacterium]